MDVIISNKYSNELSNLDIDVIKSMTGEFDVDELRETFNNFFYEHIIIDVTALLSYDNHDVYHDLVQFIDPDKMILLLPEGSILCTPNFLVHLINDGIYNFTTSTGGIVYLLKKPNTYKEVEHIVKMTMTKKKEETPKEEGKSQSVQQVDESKKVVGPVNNTEIKSTKIQDNRKSRIIGFKNVTDSGGATTLIYMIKKELAIVYGQESVMAIEVDKNDFIYFYDKRMISTRQVELLHELKKHEDVHFILVDVNGCRDLSFCDDVIYLIEPSTLKMNRLMRKDPNIFKSLVDKKVVLNQSVLQTNDVYDFEREAGIKVFYNIPALDERKRNSVIADFLAKLGYVESSSSENSSGKIFGLFRR